MGEALAAFGGIAIYAGMILLFVAWGRKLADNRGRSRTVGGWLGGVLGFIGVGIVALMGTDPDVKRARAAARADERSMVRFWVMGLIGGGFALLVVGAAAAAPTGSVGSSPARTIATATAQPIRTATRVATARPTPVRTAAPTATVDVSAALLAFAGESFIDGCTDGDAASRSLCVCAWDYVSPRITDRDWDQLMNGQYPARFDDLAYEAAVDCYLRGYR